MKQELKRRSRATDRVVDLLRLHKSQWVPVHEVAKAGGFCSWRTRVSDGRKLVERDGETIQWNGDVRESAYRLIDMPLGRDAGMPTIQPSLY